MPNSTRSRALRDQSRRVIAGLQLQYADETGIKSLKIKHNNVLGYFIEVTAGNAGSMTDTAEAKARFIHRQTMANAMRFTTTELADLESRIANAADRALRIELAAFDRMVGGRRCRSRSDQGRRAGARGDRRRRRAGAAGRGAGLLPARSSTTARCSRSTGGRHPVVEQALRRQAGGPSSPTIATCRR